MSFDSFTLYGMLPELRDRLVGARVREIAQPSPQEILLRLKRADSDDGDVFLLLSAHPVHARVHFVPRFPKTKETPHFANVLLKHLVRSEIHAVEQMGLDRVLLLRFSPPSSLMNDLEGDRLLIAELMGKHSNLILVHGDSNKILDSVKHLDESVNRYREVLPGVSYVRPPESKRAEPFTLTRTLFDGVYDASSQKAVWKQLLEGIDGLSPATAKDIVVDARSGSPDALWESYRAFIGRMERREFEPCVLLESPEPDAKPLGFRLFPPRQTDNGHLVRYSTVCDAVAAYYDRITAIERMESLRHRLRQVFDHREDAILRRLTALRQEMTDAEGAETYRIFGELLMAASHKIPPRSAIARVENYYETDAPTVEIPMDPMKSAVENAQAYFKRYQKAVRGLRLIAQRIADNEQEMEWVAEFRAALEKCATYGALEGLRLKLVEEGWIADESVRKKKPTKDVSPYRVYTSSGGWQIFIGRNDRENEFLVTRVARKDDMWLHAKEIPGSHVLIRNPERKDQIPMPTLLEAAQMAAYFSKARQSSNVPVDYTWAKWVVRPKGTAAGFVTYTHEKTLYVKPDVATQT